MWGGLAPSRLERTGQAEPRAPSCIICKYCEVGPPSDPARSPLSVPPRHRYCTLQASSGRAGPRAQALGVKAVGLVTPKTQCGVRGEEGPPGVTAGKELAPQAPPPARVGPRGFCSEPQEWASGALGRGGPRGKQRASQGTPTFSLKYLARTVPGPEPVSALAPEPPQRREARGLTWGPGWCGRPRPLPLGVPPGLGLGTRAPSSSVPTIDPLENSCLCEVLNLLP